VPVPARLLATCRSYAPGHQIHWLRKEEAAVGDGVSADSLSIVGVDIDLHLADGRTLYWRHHDPGLIARADEVRPGELCVHVETTTLHVGEEWFSCADAAWPWESCSRH